MHDFAIDLARRAGALLRDGLRQQRQIDLKSPFELVTDMDRASEQLIVGAIRAAYPSHAILAEESGGAIDPAQPTWIIDPLDGTNNYAHGFPFFCVSIGLWAGQQPLLGAVYDPLRDELFHASAGAGAFCNDRRLQVSPVPSLAASLISTGFPYRYADLAENNLRQFDRIQARCQGVRRAGAAALDISYVAAGRLEAHWELDLKPWDTAAAAVVLLEAGGRITGAQGQPWHPWDEYMIASNGQIHDELMQALS
jgi:myo-inositol-1(or 4)-monophosphatase